MWIHSGKVVNRETNAEVGATWASLNGYGDMPVLDVRETTILSACCFNVLLKLNIQIPPFY